MTIAQIFRTYFSHAWGNVRRADIVLVIITLAASTFLLFLPTGFERQGDRSIRAKALILETSDNMVVNYGVVMQGEQIAAVRVVNGK